MRLNIQTTWKNFLLRVWKVTKHDPGWFALLDDEYSHILQRKLHQWVANLFHIILPNIDIRRGYTTWLERRFCTSDFAGCISPSFVKLDTALRAAYNLCVFWIHLIELNFHELARRVVKNIDKLVKSVELIT